MDSKFDIIIVGAGIVGLATAYYLKKNRPELNLAIVEKEEQIGLHQTGHNSGVIHSGIYYTPGSLKAKNCIKGYHQLLDFCEEHQILYELCGKIIVATNESEQPQLELILEKGKANGLQQIKKISREETLEIEPHVNAIEAIRVPEAGIINYLDLANTYADLIEKAGAKIFTNNRVQSIKLSKEEQIVITNQQELQAKILINCAGLYADKLAEMTGQKTKFKILPFRGEYYELVKEKEYLVNHLIYPVPNPNFPFLGVHFTRMIKGGIEAGPNAVLAFRREGYSRWDINVPELLETLSYSGFQKLARKYWKDGLGELHRSYSKTAFVKALQHLIPNLENKDLRRGGAGVRAQACRADGSLINDFLILETKGVINVCNAPSPAATSSLSIGETIGEKALQHWDNL